MAEENVKTYPYLGRFITTDEKQVYVVFFTDEDEGSVVLSENPNIKFGRHGGFDEALFEPLEKGYVIRLEN